jgi:FAR-17a/AIG1-like protein
VYTVLASRALLTPRRVPAKHLENDCALVVAKSVTLIPTGMCSITSVAFVCLLPTIQCLKGRPIARTATVLRCLPDKGVCIYSSRLLVVLNGLWHLAGAIFTLSVFFWHLTPAAAKLPGAKAFGWFFKFLTFWGWTLQTLQYALCVFVWCIPKVRACDLIEEGVWLFLDAPVSALVSVCVWHHVSKLQKGLAIVYKMLMGYNGSANSISSLASAVHISAAAAFSNLARLHPPD